MNLIPDTCPTLNPNRSWKTPFTSAIECEEDAHEVSVGALWICKHLTVTRDLSSERLHFPDRASTASNQIQITHGFRLYKMGFRALRSSFLRVDDLPISNRVANL
jgi:hypothetical protein